MGCRVYWTHYGRPAADVLRARVGEAKRDDPLAPATVVVPGHLVGVAARRTLAAGALRPGSGRVGVAGLRVLTVLRAAELIAAPRLARRGLRPLSAPVVAAAVRAELAIAPGMFAGVRSHPSTEESLVRAHRELGDLDEPALVRLADGGPRPAEVVGLCRRVRSRLAASWYDEHDLLGAAEEAVRTDDSSVAGLGRVVLYLPQRLGRSACALVRALAERVDVDVVAGLTGDHAADDEVVRTVARLAARSASPDVATAPGGMWDGPSPERPAGGHDEPATEVVVTSDADDEVRTAVRVVLDAARAGTALSRIAVLYPSREPYARLLTEQFAAAGIACNGVAARTTADRVAGRWLLQALALPDRDFARARVLELLAATPGKDGRGTRHPVAAFDRVSRAAGVVGGADWTQRLSWYARRARQDAAHERSSADCSPARAARLEADAAAADALATTVAELRGRLQDGRRLRAWSELAVWARTLLAECCADERAREGWPEAERVAAGRVEATLDRLACLDDVDGDAGMAVFRRTLELELGAEAVREGRFGDGVLVGELSAGLGLELDVVVLCGLAEGLLPSAVHEDTLLPDVERSAVADDLPTRASRVAVQRRHLTAALASAPRRVLLYPRGDLRRSVERPPSRWLLEAVADLPGQRSTRPDGTPDLQALPTTAPWLRRVASFDAGIRRAHPATAQEYRLRALARRRAGGDEMDDAPLVVGDRVLRRAVELLRARRAAVLTRFDGELSGLEDLHALVSSPVAQHAMAPTRLEAYARCPLAYLLHHVLGVEAVEDPEEQVEITPLELGSLVHTILDRWMTEVLDDPPGHGSPYTPAQRRRLLAVAEECCDQVVMRGVAGHPRLWAVQRRSIMRDLDRFLDADDHHRAQHGLRPEATELAFGIDDADPVAVTLADGRVIRFRGRLDRLDGAADGALVVTDYKTGSGASDEYRWLAGDPVARGRLLQLPVYALAARQWAGASGVPVRARYWFCTERGQFRPREVDVDAEAEDRFTTVVATLVESMHAGLFPAVPARPDGRPFVECPFCDPDGLGTAQRRREWERKRTDPRVASLVAVLEPEEDR